MEGKHVIWIQALALHSFTERVSASIQYDQNQKQTWKWEVVSTSSNYFSIMFLLPLVKVEDVFRKKTERLQEFVQ